METEISSQGSDILSIKIIKNGYASEALKAIIEAALIKAFTEFILNVIHVMNVPGNWKPRLGRSPFRKNVFPSG